MICRGKTTPQWAVPLMAQVNEMHLQLTQIQKGQAQIMSEVQVDQSVLDGAAESIEQLVTASRALVAAVTTFLANPQVQALPEGVVTGLDQALTDSATAQTAAAGAQTALANATPPAPAPSS